MFGANYFGSTYFGQSYPAIAAGVPTWVSPANHVSGQIGTIPLVFVIPQAANALHFEIQVDTASTFDSGNLQTFKSWLTQSGWEYWDGVGWQAMPVNGVPQDYIGNHGRFVGADLATGTWYRRMRTRVKI